MIRDRSLAPTLRERRHVICEQLERRQLFSGAPVPAVTLVIPPEEMINESFQFAVNFDNASATPTDVGYTPFIDLHVPDAIDLTAATYLGSPVNMTLAGMFDGGGNLVDINTLAPVNHPLMGTPVTGGTPGDLLYVVELPFGSFVPDQPVASVSVQATLNKADGAVVGVPLTVNALGGFALGCDPLDNPGIDPPILGTATSAAVTPTVLDLTKQSNAPEQERSTGPNFPVTYSLTLDIADGETVTNVDLSDLLPDSFVYRDDVAIIVAPGVVVTGMSTTETPVPFVVNLAPDNNFLIEFASITGTPADNDISVTYSVYVAEFDALGQPVIDAATGDDVLAVNDASATASYGAGIVSDNDAATDSTLSQQSLSIQKGYSIVNDVGAAGATPGDTVEYLLDLQVSDFFSFSNLVIDDRFSDGQRFDAAFTPTFEFFENGAATSGGFSVGNYTVTLNSPGDGSTDLHFDVSAEDLDGLFVGDLFADAIQTGGTTIRVRYRTVIQEDFSDTFPSGDPSVDVGDILTNSVITAAMLPSGQFESDASGTSMAIQGPSIQKAAYAIDGSPTLPGDRLVVGHTITYRLTLTLPSADSENLVLTDYLPLPIFSATELITFDNTGPTSTAPAAGVATYGPSHTLHTIAPSTNPPTLLIDPAANSITFQFGSFDTAPSVPATVDILFTVSAQDVLMADDLALTNQVQATYGTTNSGQTQSSAIVQTIISAPDLQLTKGAVSSNAATTTFSPATVGPVPFIAPGMAGAPFAGSINSAGLTANPVDSNLAGIDAGDLVKFAIVIENRGSADAFDLSIVDSLPTGFQIPTLPSGLNLQVRDGDGGIVSYLGAAAQLFSTGIEIVDAAGQGAINNFDDAQLAGNGSNILVITYDLEATGSVIPNTQLVNTALIDRYGAIEGGNDHTAGSSTGNWEDTATVTARNVTPTKSIAATSEAHTTFVSGSERVAIGEIIRYRLVLQLPEGTSPNLQLVDVLPNRLQFLNDGTAAVAFVSDGSGVTSSDLVGSLNLGLGTGPAMSGNETNLSSIVPSFALPDDNVGSSNDLSSDPDVYGFGTDVYFKLGDVVNADRDANLEYIIVEFNALVLNAAAASNDQNDVVSNYFQSAIQTPVQVDITSSNTVNATIAEPLITNLTKIVSTPTADAGDVVTFTVTYSNPNTSTRAAAFDARMLDALSPDLALNLGSVNVVLGGGATGINNNSAGNTVDVTIDVVPLGGSVTITYSATVLTSVTAGSAVNDSADLSYSSLPGPQGTLGNPTGSLTPGFSGADVGERDGSGGVNDYTDSDSASITIAVPTMGKSLLNTSVVNAANAVNEAVIGEFVQYQVEITAPEGTTNNLVLLDTLDAGLTWVSLDSISASGSLSSSTVDLNDATSLTPIVSGSTVRFDLGNVINSNTNNGVAEVITLVYSVRVDNIIGNQGIGATTLLDNTALIQYDVAGNPQSSPSSSAATVEVIEPDLQVTVMASPATADANDIVTFTIVVGHTADSDTHAYDVSFSDVLPSEVVSSFPGDFSIIHSALGDISASFEVVAGELRTIPGMTFDLLVGETVTVTVQGTLSGTVPAGRVISHDPQIAWSSLDGTIPGERDGSGGVNDYTDSDSASITIAVPTMGKSLLNTSVVNAANAVNEAVIGEFVQYQVEITAPEGTTNNLVLLDTLDAGLTWVSLDSISASGSLSSSTVDLNDATSLTPIVSGSTVRFDLGNVINSNTNNGVAEVITLVYSVRVDNIIGNQGIGATTLLDNTALIQYDVAGNPQSSPSSSAATVEVIEPDLQVTVMASPATADANDIVTFTIVVGHTVDSDTHAYDVSFSDVLPSEVVSSFPGDFSIIHSALGDISASFEVVAGELRTIPGMTFDLLVGETVTVTVQGTLSGTVPAGLVISHDPQVAWSSLDGTIPGERDGSGGVNDYADTGSGSLSVVAATISKSLVSSSIVNVNNSATQAVIGETAQYSVTLTIPEGIMDAAQLVDVLDGGLEFVQLDGILVQSGGNPTTDVTTDIGTGDFSDLINFQPTISGQTITFDLGNLLNANADNSAAETITITYTARVRNVAGNQTEAPTMLANSALAQWIAGMTPMQSALANATPLEVIEPELSVLVAVDSASPILGEVITYTVTLDHTSDSDGDAFDLRFGDTIAAGLTLDLASIQVFGASIVANTSAGNSVDLQLDQQLLGDTITLQYQATVSTSPAILGNNLVNAAAVTWTSLNGASPHERTGAGGVNDYIAGDNINVTPVNPDLTIDKNDGLASVIPGQTYTYTLTVTNQGTAVATGIQVVDLLPIDRLQFVSTNDPGNVTYNALSGQLDWTPGGTLGFTAGSNTIQLQVTVQVPSTVAAGMVQIVNSASVTHADIEPTPANNVDDDIDTLVAAPDYQITIDDGQGIVSPSDTLTYIVTVQNVGNQDGTGVVVTDAFPTSVLSNVTASLGGIVDAVAGTVTWNVGSLAAGDVVVYSVTADVRNPLAAGIQDVTSTANVTDDGANGPDPTPLNNTDSDTDTLAAAPDYQITIDDGQTIAPAGSSIRYTLTAQNVGDQDGTGVVITSSYDTNVLTNVTASLGGVVDTVAGTVTWNLGNLAAGGLATLAIDADVINPIAAGIPNFTTTADITDDGSNGPDPTPLNNQDNDTDSLQAVPDYQVTIDDGLTNAAPGDTLTYNVAARNVGTQDGTGVVLVSTYDTNVLTNVTASGGGVVDPVAGTITWNLGAFSAGGIANFTVTGDVLSTVAAGLDDLTTTASISDDGTNGPDPTPADNTDDDIDLLNATPDYQVTVDDGLTSVSPGDSLTYTLNIGNVGNQGGTGVVVTTSFPNQLLTNVVASNGGIVDTVAGTITWNVGALNSGGNFSLTVTGDVFATVGAGWNTLTTTAQVTDDGANGPDPTPANNVDDDIDTLVAAPDYQITIDDGQGIVSPSDTLTYIVTVQNVGNQDGTGVVVTDAFPTSVLSNVTASLGGIVDAVAGTVTWNVGSLAAGDVVVYSVTADVRNPLAAGIQDVTSTANVTDDGANGPDPTPLNNTDSDTDTLAAAPDYQITIDDGQTIAPAGSSIRYTLTAQNVGDQDGTGVVITSSYDTNVLTNVTASLGGVVDTVAGTVTWNLGNLAAGGLATLAIDADVINPIAAGIPNFTTTADITDDGSNGPDPTPLNNQDNDTDSLQAVPDYQVTIDDGLTNAAPGDTLTYNVAARNVGTQDGTGVVLVSTYDTNVLTNVTASGGGVVDPVAGTITWNLGAFSAGGIANFTVTGDVLSTVAAGLDDLTTTASISDDGTNGPDPTPADNTDDDIDLLNATPDYQVTVDDGLTSVSPGDSLTYTLNVGNVGNQGGTGVVVTTSFPNQLLTNVVASNGGIVDTVAGTITWNVGALNSGGNFSLTVTGDVFATVGAGWNTLTTTAQVTDDGANGPDPTPANNVDDDIDTLVAAPDYQITIDDGRGSVSPGDTLTYIVTVQNVGNQDGTGVVVTGSYLTSLLSGMTASHGGIVNQTTGTVVWNLPSLTAGGRQMLTMTGMIPVTVPAGIETLTSLADVSDDGTNGADPTPFNNTDDDTDQLAAHPDLNVRKSDGNMTAVPSGSVLYTLDYRNAGDQDASGVILDESLPVGTQFDVANSTPGWAHLGGGQYRFVVGYVAAGTSGQVQFGVQQIDIVAAGLLLTNTATITDDGSGGVDPTPGDNTSTEQTPVTGGSISGYSFVDTNGNGIFDTVEPAISSVQIRMAGTDVLGNNLSAVTVTDANGYYEFRDLPPGLFTIQQQQPADYDDGIDSTQTPGAVVSGNDEIMVPLQPGQVALANNFGEAGAQVGLISKRYLLSSSGTGHYNLLTQVGAPPPARQRMTLEVPASASPTSGVNGSHAPAGDPGPTSLRAPEAHPVRVAAVRLIPPISTRPDAPKPQAAAAPPIALAIESAEAVPVTIGRGPRPASSMPATRPQPNVSAEWPHDPLWRRIHSASRSRARHRVASEQTLITIESTEAPTPRREGSRGIISVKRPRAVL